MHSQPQTQTNTVVVILMGTFCPQSATRVYRKLASLFEERGYEVVIHAIPKLGLGRIDEAADSLAGAIFTTNLDQRYILVGHSQGSLIALHLARYYPEQVSVVFCLGTPFHGTRLANLGRRLRWPAIRTMAAHSRFLRELRQDQSYLASNVHSLFSVFDELVVPWFAATVAGANNVVLAPAWLHRVLIGAGLTRSRGVELVDGWSDHLGLIWHPILHSYIISQLEHLESSQ